VLKKKSPPPSAIYSNWLNDDLLKEREEEAKHAIAIRNEGDAKRIIEDRARSQRRFETSLKRLSDQTLESYVSDMRHFGKYMGRPRATPTEIIGRLIILKKIEAETLVEEYIDWMKHEEDLAPKTINRRLAAIKYFVKTSQKVGWVSWEGLFNVDSVKDVSRNDRKGPSKEEFIRILREVEILEGKGAERDRLLVYMLSFMGLRVSSVLSLDVENINFDRRVMKVLWKGDGKEYRERPYGSLVEDALHKWLRLRGYHPGPVFCSFDPGKKGSGRLTRRSADRIIARIGRSADTAERLSCHDLRHFHGSDNTEATDGNMRKVQLSLGHEDMKTTQMYDDQFRDYAREVTESMESRYLEVLKNPAPSPQEEFEEEDQEEFEDFLAEPIDDDFEESFQHAPSKRGPLKTAAELAKNFVKKPRISCGFENVDRVLGGGIVLGSLVLIAGQPGIGKSTLTRQITGLLCKSRASENFKALYASGEEGDEQILEGFMRLESVTDNLYPICENNIEVITQIAEENNVDILIVDSISTVKTPKSTGKSGSTSQVRACAEHLMEWKTKTNVPVLIVSHIDKLGKVAGPKALEHDVDVVLMFEGNRRQTRRVLTSDKNRHGPVGQEAFFDMTKKGLIEIDEDNQDAFAFDNEEEANAKHE